jgi:hypothetical protein
LGHFGGNIGRLDLSQSGGVNEICMAREKFGECGLVAVFGILSKKSCIRLYLHLNHLITKAPEIRQILPKRRFEQMSVITFAEERNAKAFQAIFLDFSLVSATFS